MKKFDYDITPGEKVTITAKTEGARERTPEPLEFLNKESALAFVKESAAEGYRFAGRAMIDPEYQLVSYGYFVKGNGGQLIPAGQDWGPPDPSYEKGDVMPGGPTNGKHAVVQQIVGGEVAKLAGVYFMVVLEEVTVPAVAN